MGPIGQAVWCQPDNGRAANRKRVRVGFDERGRPDAALRCLLRRGASGCRESEGERRREDTKRDTDKV